MDASAGSCSEVVNPSDICGTCLRGCDLIDITDESYEETPITELLSRHVSTGISHDALLTNHMCTTCVDELISVCKFVKKCQRSLSAIKTAFERKNSPDDLEPDGNPYLKRENVPTDPEQSAALNENENQSIPLSSNQEERIILPEIASTGKDDRSIANTGNASTVQDFLNKSIKDDPSHGINRSNRKSDNRGQQNDQSLANRVRKDSQPVANRINKSTDKDEQCVVNKSTRKGSQSVANIVNKSSENDDQCVANRANREVDMDDPCVAKRVTDDGTDKQDCNRITTETNSNADLRKSNNISSHSYIKMNPKKTSSELTTNRKLTLRPLEGSFSRRTNPKSAKQFDNRQFNEGKTLLRTSILSPFKNNSLNKAVKAKTNEISLKKRDLIKTDDTNSSDDNTDNKSHIKRAELGTTPTNIKSPIDRLSSSLTEEDVENDVINDNRAKVVRKRILSTSTCLSEDADDFDTLSITTKSELNTAGYDYEYKCDVCPCSFMLVSSLAHHRKVHGIAPISKPYLCEICGETSMNFSKFRIHRKDHGLEQPYACLYCEKTVRGPLIFNNHIRYHTVELGELSMMEKLVVIEKLCKRGRYVCALCGKLFYSRNVLETHLLWHPDEAKLFGCSYCDKTFTQKRSLRNHEFLHKGEKKEKPNTC